jgi:hypothetical protein
VIPRGLWRGEALRVVGEVQPPRFRLSYDRRWHDDGGDPLELRGEVASDASGGSRITARCGLSRQPWMTALVLAGVALWIVLSVERLEAAVAAAAAGCPNRPVPNVIV